MKMRSPRSSFHQAVVSCCGIRRSSSRASAMTACRTSRNSCSGSMGANTWMPRLPEVFTNPVRPTSASRARRASAAGTASANPVPGCGSRSMRSWSGLSGSPARDAHGWKTIVFICAAHTAPAGSSSTSCGCRRPLGYVTVTSRTHAGAPFGGFLEKNCSPSTPPGNRWSDTGRSPLASMNGSPTATRYSASSSFVMPSSGQSTRDGLEMRTSRSPLGPGTEIVAASPAMSRMPPSGPTERVRRSPPSRSARRSGRGPWPPRPRGPSAAHA